MTKVRPGVTRKTPASSPGPMHNCGEREEGQYRRGSSCLSQPYSPKWESRRLETSTYDPFFDPEGGRLVENRGRKQAHKDLNDQYISFVHVVGADAETETHYAPR